MGLIDSCAGSDLIVLPELWHVGLLSYRTIWNFAEEKDGPAHAPHLRKGEAAERLHPLRQLRRKMRRQALQLLHTLRPQGTDLAVYHKIHLFSCYGHEADTFTHGDKAVVVDTEEFGRVGLSICYDIRFPELFRRMTAGLGAEVFIAPTAWPYPRKDAFTMCARVRALENSRALLRL
ncbi:nitrilase-related carbon-nitrogen hydrolase [uncultured Cloacibacillus sp.]|uniref:carbon-nitrogen hydrolase family protein n=1 Tax=uncultured Cloacibacillus sp. TaxID=889794 RepID=UPI00320B109C